ncbi:HNH/endonuclease VII fold putative polymorphic toxin [Pseudomonas sp. 2822-15]|uniref:HNH/endonuclease VII fold putative polymorphic toxin n=1 Tax=Pseudomonas sp. 2822-15 TaxID=1712677 RepID=UPI0035323DCA
MDDPVAQELLKLLRQTTYDVPGLLQGNPGEPTSLSPNPSGWGDMFAMDKQVAYAKSLKEGWLTPQEAADLDRWNASTTWVDRMYGHKLEPGEKAAILTELGTAGAAALMSGRGSIGAAGPKGTIPENMSPIGAGRSGAFNEAKRQSGIPTSQQPSRVLPNVDKRGNPQPGKIYEFEVPAPGGGLKTVRIRDDAGGHDFGSGNSQNRGPHFNDKTGNHYDY